MPPAQNITPDRWVLLEITSEEGVFRKILSAWRGGYLDGDSWRLSSTIVDETEMEHLNEYTTKSGSTYRCLHSREGLTGKTSMMLEKFKKEYSKAKIKVLCYGDQT